MDVRSSSYRQPIDPLAQEVARFLVETYLPRLLRMLRQSISMKSIGWFALAATVVAAPFVVMALLRSLDRRSSHSP